MAAQQNVDWLGREYHQFPLWYFFCFCLGIIGCFSIASINIHASIGGMLVCFLGYYFAKRKGLVKWHFFCLCFCFLAFGELVANIRQLAAGSDKLTNEGVYLVEGEVVKVKPTSGKYQLILQNTNVTSAEFVRAYKFQRLRVNIAAKYAADINCGSYVNLRAKLFPLQQSVLPGSYNFGFFLGLAGYGATGYALSRPETISPLQNKPSFIGYINNLRNKIYKRLVEVCAKDEANFIAALIIGETKGIPNNVANAARNSGIAHILAVSGLHLSLVAIFCFGISVTILGFSNFALNRLNLFLISGLVSILCSYFYLLISGSNIAAERAFLMTSTFTIASIINRRLVSLRPVIYAGFVILSLMPEYLFHPSFQLSFTAVICLISGYQASCRIASFFRLNSNLLEHLKLGLLTNISSSFLTSFCTAPFVIYHFYNFSAASLPMNLIVVPLMSFFIMPLALLSIVVMPIGLDYWLLKLVEKAASFVIWLAIMASDNPWSVIYIGHLSPAVIAWFAVGFCWLCFWQGRMRFIGVIFMLIALYSHNHQPSVTMIIDPKRQAIGYIDPESRFIILGTKKMPSFITNYWASWYGQKETIYRQDANLFIPDDSYLLPNGKIIAFNYSSCNDLADYSINLDGGIRCKGAINYANRQEVILLYK